jgi:hypothetical protein
MENKTLQNITVTGCTFVGLGEGLEYFNGLNCTISSNSFLFPMGRDSGSGTDQGQPNVGVCLGFWVNNPYNMWNHNVQVYSNYFNGLSATNSVSNLFSGHMGDGFLNSQADEVYCYDNIISNNGVEGIYMISPTTNAVSPCYIYSNTVTKAISLLTGLGIVCNVSGSQIYRNTVSNCFQGLEVWDSFLPNPATNISFYSNTVTVGSLSNFYALGLWVGNAVECKFTNNTFILNLANVVTSDGSSFPTFNTGIAVYYQTTNDYFTNNSFTIASPTNSVTNGSGYYGIALDSMFLDINFDNFVNNTFTNGGGGVYATGYPFGPGAPNTDGTNQIDTNIVARNFFE